MSRKQVVSVVVTAALATAFVAGGSCFASDADSLKAAKDLYVAGSFDSALEQLNGLSPKDPATLAEVLKQKGYCYRAKAMTSRALETFQKISTDYPKSKSLTQDVRDTITGLAYYTSADTDQFVPYARSMAAKYPDDLLMWHLLACDSLRSKGMEAEALVELLRAWDQPASKANQLWERKANIRMFSMSYAAFDRMITDAKAVLSKSPEDGVLWEYTLGHAYLCKQQTVDAVTHLEAAAKLLTPRSAYGSRHGRVWRTINYALGCAYEMSKQYDKALPLHQGVAKEFPDFWRAHYSVFTCLAKQNKIVEASAYINQICLQRPATRDRLRKTTMDYIIQTAGG